MLLTGDFIDAARALDQGLVNRVVAATALDETIAGFASAIISKTPVAIAVGKKVFYEQLDTGLDRAYALATDTMVCNMMTADAAEGIDAFMQKRTPQWQGK